ncbi:MAG: Fur family transcriptional regulator [Christensenellales bacterium]|jgi:Fe2+ or Zn2+ uptake regulation protein
MKRKASGLPGGLKKTKQREYVLDTLEKAGKPISAAEIYATILKDGHSVSLSTVYRILYALQNKEAVIKTTIMDSDTSLYELNRSTHRHYAYCVDCRKAVAMDACPIEKFLPGLDEAGFEVIGHKMEVYGHCSKCALNK